MARGSKTAEQGTHTAQAGAQSGLNFSSGLQNNATGIYSTLAPQLTSQAIAPSGYAPSDLAAMNTAAQQSAGGATAAAKGEGGLLAARTRNAGAPAAAIAKSVRGASEGLGDKAVGIQVRNAEEKQRQRSEAQRGLEGLYGTNVSGANEALGEAARNEEANAALNQADAAQKKSGFWSQLGGDLTQLGSAYLGARR